MARNPAFYLRQWRELRGLRQRELADRLDTTEATISRWENGKANWSGDSLMELARVLGCEPPDFWRDPNKPEAKLWSAVRAMSEEQQGRALEMLNAAFGDREDGKTAEGRLPFPRGGTGKRTRKIAS